MLSSVYGLPKIEKQYICKIKNESLHSIYRSIIYIINMCSEIDSVFNDLKNKTCENIWNKHVCVTVTFLSKNFTQQWYDMGLINPHAMQLALLIDKFADIYFNSICFRTLPVPKSFFWNSRSISSEEKGSVLRLLFPSPCNFRYFLLANNTSAVIEFFIWKNIRAICLH